MDLKQHTADLLAWYIGLAIQPGWKAYAWHRVQELAALDPGLYGEFPEKVKAAALTHSASTKG